MLLRINDKQAKKSAFFMPQKEVAVTITDKQRAFVDEYLIDLNATRAYKAVYKSCKKDEAAAANASKLLRNTKVAAYLAQRQRDIQQRTEITQDNVVQELAAIAFADIADYVQVKDYDGQPAVVITPTNEIPISKRKAIAGIKQSSNGIELKLHNKLDALDKLGRHLGLFKQAEDNRYENELADKLKELIDELE